MQYAPESHEKRIWSELVKLPKFMLAAMYESINDSNARLPKSLRRGESRHDDASFASVHHLPEALAPYLVKRDFLR